MLLFDFLIFNFYFWSVLIIFSLGRYQYLHTALLFFFLILLLDRTLIVLLRLGFDLILTPHRIKHNCLLLILVFFEIFLGGVVLFFDVLALLWRLLCLLNDLTGIGDLLFLLLAFFGFLFFLGWGGFFDCGWFVYILHITFFFFSWCIMNFIFLSLLRRLFGRCRRSLILGLLAFLFGFFSGWVVG